MASALHLLKGADAALPAAVIARQLAAGDRVTVVLLAGAEATALPPAVTVRHLPEDLSYGELLELIFDADHVVTW
jgi:hypothetical protein